MTISQLHLNETVRKRAFLLREKAVSMTRAGDAILRITVADRTGSIPGVMFDPPGYVADSLVVGKGVEVTGRVSEFRGQLQITLERVGPTELGDLSAFLPTARRPQAEMEEELLQVWEGISNPHLRALLDVILGDEAFYRLYVQSPAAKTYHHACIGGLLEHTLSVVRLVRTACDLYPEMDADVAMTVALLHDLGKVRSYDPVSFDLTEEGSLWTHLYVGASMVEKAIDSLPEFDPELRLRVVHAILAHHGRLEHGSPTVPMTIEAMVVHYADNMDGDTRGAIERLDQGENDGTSFTDFSPMHDTRLYRGRADAPGGQGTLF
jgi:3'-5' exoribonuclease